MGSLRMGNGAIVPSVIINGGNGDTIIATNTIGAEIKKDDKVWIKYNPNSETYKIVSYANISPYTFSGIAKSNASVDETVEVSTTLPNVLYFNPKFGDRLGDGDGIATVVGNFTDSNDQTYVYAVLDAKYMNKLFWSTLREDTGLPNYTDSTSALNAKESATYNTDYILSNYTPTNYPAFNYCNTCTSIELNKVIYKPKLPNAYELKQIYDNRSELYALDPTASSYTAYNLANWNFNGIEYAYCSNEYSSPYIWGVISSGDLGLFGKDDGYYGQTLGITPIFEIPIN